MDKLFTLHLLIARFDPIYAFLDQYLGDQGMVKIINNGKPAKDQIVANYFSKYVNHEKNKKIINAKTFRKIIDPLEAYINENHSDEWIPFKVEWDKSKPAILTKSEIGRLRGLNGVWVVYTWDKFNSTEEVGRLHYFKVHITSFDNIICNTYNSDFKGKIIHLIPKDNKVVIEMVQEETGRKIYLYIPIGNSAYLELLKRPYFGFAYLDSGEFTVAAGLGILERSSFDDYSLIEPSGLLATDLELKKGKNFLRCLLEKQLLLDFLPSK